MSQSRSRAGGSVRMSRAGWGWAGQLRFWLLLAGLGAGTQAIPGLAAPAAVTAANEPPALGQDAAEWTRVPAVVDLGASLKAAGAAGVPLLLFVESPGCGFCHAVEYDNLLPLARIGRFEGQAVLGRLELVERPMLDAAGQPSTQRAVARALGVDFAPTVLFLNAKGKPLIRPLIGLVNRAEYGGQLPPALTKAQDCLRDAGSGSCGFDP